MAPRKVRTAKSNTPVNSRLLLSPQARWEERVPQKITASPSPPGEGWGEAENVR